MEHLGADPLGPGHLQVACPHHLESDREPPRGRARDPRQDVDGGGLGQEDVPADQEDAVLDRAEPGQGLDQVTVADLELARTPRTRAILLGYPNNPTGAVLERSRLEEIAAWAVKNDILVVSDEIYDRLVYGIDHTCVSSLPGMCERTILLGGFSKSHAMTGWRIGYVAAPPALLAAMRKIHQYIIMSAPTTGQEAAIEALKLARTSGLA